MKREDDTGANAYGLAAGIAFFFALIFVSLKNAKGPEPDPGFVTFPTDEEIELIEFGKAPDSLNIKTK